MANLKRWSRGEIIRMRSEVDRLFDDLCADFDLPAMVCRMAGDLELYEEGNVLVVRLELGNMSPDDVLVSVSDTRLSVSAKSVGSRIGRSRLQTFRRELRLPCVVKKDEVLVEFEDGILVIRLPKSTAQLGQHIEIVKK